jgi:hypothetical protein
MYLIGGFSLASVPLNDVIVNKDVTDATAWTKVTEQANYTPRAGHSIVVYNQMLVMW